MKYLLITLFLVFIGSSIWAQLPYYPLTSIAEDVTSTWCTNCAATFAGLDIVESQVTPGNFFSVRYYTQSGPDWAFEGIDDRIAYYQVMGVPSVIFDGKVKLDGGFGVDDGVLYSNTLEPYRFSSSPVKMEILDFDPVNLEIQVKVTMYDSTYVMTDAPIYFLLLQDSIADTHKNVTRDMKTDIVNVSGNGNSVQFTKTFTPSVSINPDSLWVAAFIQTGDHTILQAVCSKPMPDYYSRIIMPFKQNITGDLDTPYQSVPFPVWNLGNADNFTIKLVLDDAPGYWDLGFCNTSGSCFPQNIAIPFSLGRDDYTRFYLDVNPHVSGIAHFHFEFTQEHTTNTVIIPFTYTTSDVANDDNSAPTVSSARISNSPNPFGQSTRISYQLNSKNTDKVSLEIYNIKGQLVKSFSHLPLNNGEGTLVWNGSGNDGRILPSGIYFSKLNGVPGAKTHKMIIFR